MKSLSSAAAIHITVKQQLEICDAVRELRVALCAPSPDRGLLKLEAAGTKGKLIAKFMIVRSILQENNVNLDKLDYIINSSMRYETVAEKSRKLLDWLWNAQGYGNRAKQLRDVYFKVKADNNWSHHSSNDPTHKHYDVTVNNQRRLLENMELFLGGCGLSMPEGGLGLSSLDDDCADELCRELEQFAM
eukprot:gene9397-9561_t